MNNEEKILSMLEHLTSKVDKLEQGQTRLEQSYATLEQGQTRLGQSFAMLEQNFVTLEQGQADLCATVGRLEKIAAVAENEHFPNIRHALENHIDLVDKDKHLDTRLRKAETKLDRHDAEIFALKTKVAAG